MTMRITGMSSGLNVDDMIKKLMTAERMPVNKLLQQKQKLQWKVEAYSSLNLKFSSMRESLSSLRFGGAWNKVDGSGNTVRLSEDEMVEKVKAFVEKYNDTVTTANNKVVETANRGFNPLTSDEKSAMNETDVKNWEEKAQAGLLRNDDTVKKAVTNLRGLASSVVAGVDADFDTMFELGISTTKYLKGSPENGKLVIDETKLRNAIRTDKEAVISAFTAQGTDPSEKGFFQKAFEAVDEAIISISRKINGGLDSAESLTKQMSNIDKKVDRKNDQLNSKEDRYYQMFANMEKAIANGNAQLSWLMQQFG